jgi:hypothetical protein
MKNGIVRVSSAAQRRNEAGTGIGEDEYYHEGMRNRQFENSSVDE